MDLLTIFLFVILLLVFGGGFFFLFQKIDQLTTFLKGEEILQRLELHKGELGANLKSLDERLHAVTTEIGGVKDVTTQLKEFQTSLKSQKLRGNVGEAVLKDLLRQVLPKERYEIQYAFRNRKTVDAVVKTSGGALVPVDSKFPVENFQTYVATEGEGAKQSAWRTFSRDVKKRMDETSEYILPEEGTTPFALMYIPYEPIFQDVVADHELWQYALSKRVYFTSPQTFWVTLQFLYLALQKEKFADRTEEILQLIHAVGRDAEAFESLLQTAVKQMTDAGSNMRKLVGVFSSLLDKLKQLQDLDSKPKK
jgi:DNA recombination protein RmuC